ncbi:MAG: hypothetical protein M1825_002018 [Sarcosagium campestre]|nr:MAG: hypothetical protein M1825_002018 [Sarcosagium campestre]
MDKTLDEVISEHQRTNSHRGGRRDRRRNPGPRDGTSPKEDYRNLDRNWIHDRFDDDENSRAAPRQDRAVYRGRERSPPRGELTPVGAKVRVDNLHYDLTQEDLEDLFTRIGPIHSLVIRYDRAGRSTGTAYVTYVSLSSAKTAIREFDGANANGQPIRLSLAAVPPPSASAARGNPFDNAVKPSRSLSERITGGPGARLGDTNGNRKNNGNSLDYAGNNNDGYDDDLDNMRDRRSDVRRPAPDGIDRYVPGRGDNDDDDHRHHQQRPGSRRGTGRRPGARREERTGGRGSDAGGHREGDGGRGGGGRGGARGAARPRKTQEELDAEMEDYWGGGAVGGSASAPASIPAPAPAPAPAASVVNGGGGGGGGDAAATAIDDVDMIE